MKKYLLILFLFLFSGSYLFAQPVLVEVITTDVSCNGDNDGTVLIRITGGAAPYTFTIFRGIDNQVSPSTADTFYTFPAVSANNWHITVEDNNNVGFSEFNAAIVSEPELAYISNEIITPISCFGDADGELQVTAAGGSGDFSFELNPGSVTNATGIYPSLSPGDYTITLSDLTCVTSVLSNTLTLTNPDLISISSESVNDVSCNGGTDGYFHVTAAGGTGAYTYTLNPDAIDNSNGNFNNLPIGTYSVDVTDANSCTSATSSSLEIKEPALLTIDSEASTDITCNGDNDGTITITASGGTAPYSFTLNPGSINNATGSFSGLTPGDYTVTLDDANSCGPVTSSIITIIEPDKITITSTNSSDISCKDDNDGTIDVTATASNNPLTYTLNPGAIQSNATGSFTALADGTYSVNVSDPLGCSEATGSIIISNPEAISITSESKIDISCNSADDGSISVTATGGTGSLHYALNPGAILQTNNGDFTGLSPNTYSVSVTDDNTCPVAVSVNFDITESAILAFASEASTDITCNGVNDGSITVTASGGTAPYSYTLNPGSITNATGIFSGLAVGSYTVSLTDNMLCGPVISSTFDITDTPGMIISLEKTDILCNGDANGTITVSATGGALPYEYSRDDIMYQASNKFIDLTQKSYTIWVRDANGCIASDDISISEPFKLIISSEFNISNNLCYGDSLGEIRILSVEGGVTPYLYSIDGGSNYVVTSDFQSLPAGAYQVMVKDDNNCIASGSLLNIDQPQEIKILNYNQVDVTGCYGDANGQIAIEGIGGTGTKIYTIDGGSSITNGIFSSVTGGSHILSISDDNGCQKDTTVIISEPIPIRFTSIALTHITGCFGDNNGIINATATDGVGALEYALDGGVFQGSGTFNSLFAGNHVISAKDANNCQTDSSIILTEPLAISIDAESAVDISCTGSDDGNVSITVSGGTTPYLYTLNPDAISNASGSFSSLTPGDYTISVDDLNNCGPVTSGTLTVAEPPALALDSVTTSEILCAGGNSAEIHIYVSGGTEPFQYSIDDGGSYLASSDFNSLSPGTYHVSALDANSCPIVIDTFNFVDPLSLVAIKETITDGAVCFGDSAGIIEFEVNGGTGSIEYSADNRISWQPSGLYNNLPSGDYTIIGRDQNNCELSSSILSINQPVEITADITTTSALDEFNLGSINISNATGGSGGLEFSITGATGVFTTQTNYPDLIAGFYDVVIRDLNLCTFDTTVEIVQIQALDVTVSITNLSCNNSGDGSIQMFAIDPVGQAQYSIDDSTNWVINELFDNLPGGEYIISARDSLGRFFGDTITIIEPVAIGIFSNITPATCTNNSYDGAIDITVNGAIGNVDYKWSTGAITEDINSLGTGEYQIDVVDENLCTANGTFVVPGIINVNANAGADTTICYGETLILNGLGGTVMSWLPITGLSNPNISNPVVESDSSISFILTVVGNNDCYDIDTINITIYPYLGLNAGSDTSIISNQSVMLTTTGGPYLSYLWEPATGVDDTTSASPTISPQLTTNYIVSGLTEDGCYDRDTIMITIIENLTVYNAFSPNSDGINDFWDIENSDIYPDIIVEVYNRWGEKFFSSVGYSDDKRWNGMTKGKEAPLGTYYYVVIPYNGATPITGPVTIVR